MNQPTVIPSAVPDQVRFLSAYVDRLDQAIRAAVRAGVPVRELFAATWVRFRKAWRIAAAKPMSEKLCDDWTHQIGDWLQFFAGEGIPFNSTAAGSILNDPGDPLIWTPSTISAELEKAKTYLHTLDKQFEVNDSAHPDPALRKIRIAWRPFIDEFDSWYNAGPSTWWGATASKAKDYIRRGQEFQTTFEQLGGKVIAPNPSPAPKPPGWSPFEKLAGLGLVVVGAVAVASMVSPTLSIARRFAAAGSH